MNDSEKIDSSIDSAGDESEQSKAVVSHPFSSSHYLMIVRKAKKDRSQKRKRASIAKQSRQLNRKLQKSR